MSVGFLTGVNFICGRWDDCGKLAGLDYGSFGSPLIAKKDVD
jgi:hypothetical protein